MPNVRVRTIILYDKRRVQPDTIDLIANAKDGTIIGLEPDEFHGIQELHLFEPEVKKLQRADHKARPRSIPDSTDPMAAA